MWCEVCGVRWCCVRCVVCVGVVCGVWCGEKQNLQTTHHTAITHYKPCPSYLTPHTSLLHKKPLLLLAGARASPAARAAELPEWPSSFSLRAFNPASFEGRAGWRLLQAHSPGRLLQLRGWRSRDTLHLQTRNLRRFHAPPEGLLTSGVVIDGQPLSPGVLEAAASANASGMN